jgi:drug/metabolite transporter (DMT)-like permease
MNTKPAALAAAGTVLLWASAFPAITVAVRGLGPAGLAVARLAVASAALAVAAPWMGGRGKAGRMGVRRPRLRDLPLIALCGLAGMTGYQLLLNAGERVVPAGTASLLVATAPVYASLLAVVFLGEHATRRRWAGSAVALAGTALIAASHGLGFGTSALIVLAAAVLQAIFHTAQKPLLARYTGFEVTAYAMWAGTVFVLPWTGSLLRALWGPGAHAGGAAIGSAVFLGLAPSAAGFVLWAYAMARTDVGRVTVSLYLVPAAAIGISLVWLGEIPGPAELIGGAIALAGVVLASGGPTSDGPTSYGRASRVAAGDEDRGRGQAGGRPGQQHQQGPARGEQVRRRVQRAHLLGRLQQREPADPAVPRRRQQGRDAGHQDHRDGGGDAARGVPDDRAEATPSSAHTHSSRPAHSTAPGTRGAPATRPGRGPPGSPGPGRTRRRRPPRRRPASPRRARPPWRPAPRGGAAPR